MLFLSSLRADASILAEGLFLVKRDRPFSAFEAARRSARAVKRAGLYLTEPFVREVSDKIIELSK